jgi:hypothetical protein
LLTFEAVTQEAKSYPMVYKSREVFLIDSPGFDDDNLCDDDVLQKIADFINNVYNLGWTIGGIIYLHDIGRVRMGNVGTLNVRVLESLTGKDNWNNISLVTNKWGTTGSPEGEALRERQLQENPKFWAAMREANCQARICRFNNTEASAKEIIDWHLSKSFVPLLSSQMVDGNAVLGETDAGLLIRKKYEAIFERNGWTDRLDAMNKRMDSAFEGMETKIAIDKLLKDLHKLEQKQMLQRAGAWVVRVAAYGGAVIATVLTENPAAFRAAIAAAGPLEMSFRSMKSKTAEKVADLRQSIASTALYGRLNSSAGIVEEQ